MQSKIPSFDTILPWGLKADWSIPVQEVSSSVNLASALFLLIYKLGSLALVQLALEVNESEINKNITRWPGA